MYDLLWESGPFAKIFQNAVGAPTVTVAKKLIPNQKMFGQDVEFSFFSLHFEQI